MLKLANLQFLPKKVLLVSPRLHPLSGLTLDDGD